MTLHKRLGSAERICRQAIFKKIVTRGVFIRGAFFYLWALLPEEKGNKKKSAIGIVVSKKTSPLATERNEWKRRMREIFRDKKHLLKEGGLFLLKAREKKRPSFSELEKDFKKIFKSAGAMK